MKSENKHIVVVGSINTDMTVKSGKLPRPGETVLGGVFFKNQGGKGANQAVAAARLGASVRMKSAPTTPARSASPATGWK